MGINDMYFAHNLPFFYSNKKVQNYNGEKNCRYTLRPCNSYIIYNLYMYIYTYMIDGLFYW